MGLDMYLKERHREYVYEPKQKQLVAEAFPNIGLGSRDSGMTVSLDVEVMYWRKQNAIHNWFVENVQNGVDDCGDYPVSIEQLMALRDTCKSVVDDHSKAPVLLPAKSGFFFGSTDYDEWYYEGAEATYNELSNLLIDHAVGKLKEGIYNREFFYRSSW